MPLNNTVIVILPGVVLAVAAIVVFVVDLFLKRKAVLAWIAVAGLLCGAAVAIGQWGSGRRGSPSGACSPAGSPSGGARPPSASPG